MIKINVVCVGKIKEKYFQDAVDEYSKRLSRFCKLNIVQCKEENFVAEPNECEAEIIKKKEGESIVKNLRGYSVLTDIGGKKFSSESFSEYVSKFVDDGQEVTFIIGGSYGVSESVKKSATDKISFSDMTFPHTLARVILLEQLYRAFKIKENGRYHK